ncbi:MAG TPA: phosphate starvation-inducible protein PhoH, partial [Sulfitobacter sp.]|nr:phosphate starvation-inducible protein PhoH [Sulfitobacter sp.]
MTPETAAERVVEFPDNRLLIDLCGAYDAHLAAIEKSLEVQIIRRGNHLQILGEGEAVEKAESLLNALYVRLESGRSVEPADVDGMLRMGNSSAGTGVRQGDQLEMPMGDAIEIQTRKKRVEPRTDAQKAYVQSLFDNELAFGIGPAGTGKTYLAVAVGVSMFIGGHVDRIILSRPAVEAGEKLGYLPGDMKDKV